MTYIMINKYFDLLYMRVGYHLSVAVNTLKRAQENFSSVRSVCVSLCLSGYHELADLRGGGGVAPGTRAPPGSEFFHSHAVFGKFLTK